MSIELSPDRITALRNERYHRTPARRVRSEEEAVAFVEEVGFAFLFGDKTVEIPTLWGAICGENRPVPRHHNDPDLGRTWRWKDTLPSRGAIYYGKLLRNKPTLVALDLLPAFYALSPNFGDLEDYLEQYAAGELSVEAKNVYEVLLKGGALATSRLRQIAGLAGGGANARRFERALTELQTQLKIVKVGISDANRWGYAYVYDLFLRRFPYLPGAARQISSDQAMETLLLRYLRNVVAQPTRAVQRLFGWDDWNWRRVLERLTARKLVILDARIEGLPDVCLASYEASLSLDNHDS